MSARRFVVIPAKAGIQCIGCGLDSSVRWNDGKGAAMTEKARMTDGAEMTMSAVTTEERPVGAVLGAIAG